MTLLCRRAAAKLALVVLENGSVGRRYGVSGVTFISTKLHLCIHTSTQSEAKQSLTGSYSPYAKDSKQHAFLQ